MLENRRHLIGPLAALIGIVVLATIDADAAESKAESYHKQMMSAYTAGLVDDALKLAGKGIKADPMDPRFYMARGHIYDFKSNHKKAAADFSEAIKIYKAQIKDEAVAAESDLTAKLTQAYNRRGDEHYKLSQFDESIADFENVLELTPDQRPYHWKLGISLYSAGRFQDGREQFESHQTVNSNDVENAVWHYLCVARLHGIQKAREVLIPIARDGRVPMMQIHALFAGRLDEEAVLKVAHTGTPIGGELNKRIFYAHLYLGLYHEAKGDLERAHGYLKKAAQKHADYGYMGDVARVHAKYVGERLKE